MEEQDSLVEEFQNIVSCDVEKAKFYLEANNWNIQTALGHYFESQEQNVVQDPVQDPVQGSSDLSTPAPSSGTTNTPRWGQSPASAKNQSARVATLGDFGKVPAEEDKDDNEPENLFAGGEKSGIFMQNPNTKVSNSLVGDILKKAAEGGRSSLEEQEINAQATQSFFTGTGYKLGSEDEPSVEITDTDTPALNSETLLEEPAVRHLTFWRNGFSIEDGPLLAYDDPANEEFLKAINSGRAPLSLLNVKQGQPVDMRVARRDEDYKAPPKKPAKPFSGMGQRLGSPTISVTTSSTTPPRVASSSSSTLQARHLELDESLPVTSVQIRMGDGTRMLARFNHTHTIRDIREFINASRIGEANRNYVLQTTFPTKDLSDETLTLAEASLLNSVVVQRYI